MRKTPVASILCFFLMAIAILIGGIATAWFWLAPVPLGEFHGIAVVLGCVCSGYDYALRFIAWPAGSFPEARSDRGRFATGARVLHSPVSLFHYLPSSGSQITHGVENNLQPNGPRS